MTRPLSQIVLLNSHIGIVMNQLEVRCKMILFIKYSFRPSLCHTFIIDLREDLGDQREDLGDQRDDLGDGRKDIGD